MKNLNEFQTLELSSEEFTTIDGGTFRDFLEGVAIGLAFFVLL